MIYVIDHNDSFTHNVVHQFALFDKVESDNYDKNSENKIIWDQPSSKKDKSIYPDSGVMFVPVRHQDCSLKSEEEAEKIKQLIKLLLSSKYKLASDDEKFISEEDIIIIAPFNVQVNYLKRKLDKKLKKYISQKCSGK